MLMLAVLGSVLVLAGVGLRQRASATKSSASTSNQSTATAAVQPSSSTDYTTSFVAPLLLGGVLLALYFYLPATEIRAYFGIESCIPPSPQNRAAEWDFIHGTPELNNVSSNAIAQTLFNQGLLWRWGYSLETAAIAFADALKLDPSCAMCYWGSAYAVSPFANIVALPKGTPFPHFSTEMNQEGRRFLEAATKLEKRSVKEADYIQAMQIRFPEVSYVERAHQEWLEFLYGAKMLALWKADPADLIAGSLAAEAFVNCMPWDYYAPLSEQKQPFGDAITWGDLIHLAFPTQSKSVFTQTTGQVLGDAVLDGFPLKDATQEEKIRDHRMRPLARVVEHLLLRIRELDPAEPLVAHLTIHLTEASMANEPRKGLSAAHKLAEESVKWKASHLVHMPSHTYLRVGEYHKAIQSNEAAHQLDLEISRQCFHPYVPEHNLMVLIAAASMGGLLDKAEEYAQVARVIRNGIAQDLYISGGWDYVTLLDVWAQFGQWEKILKEPPPSAGARGGAATNGFEYATAIYHFSRYMALSHQRGGSTSRKLLMQDMATELVALEEAAKKVDKAAATAPGVGVGVYSAAYYERTQIALLYAKARNATLNENRGGAIRHVEEIVDLVEEMGYMEPPWPQQAPRQCLGYLLFQDRQYDAAKDVYDRDLGENPRNPWSTLGLAQLYSAQRKLADAELMFKKYQKSGSSELKCSCPLLLEQS